MDTWTAGAASLAIGLASFPYSRYSYWTTWNGWWVAPAATLFLLLQFAAGVLGSTLAHATEWNPSSSELLNGALFGIAGASLLRVRLDDFGPGGAGRATTAMRRMIEAITDWMDGLALKHLEKYLDTLDEKKIVRLIRRVGQSDVRLSGTPGERESFKSNVKNAIQQMESPDPDVRNVGFETLRGILIEWYMRLHGTWRM